MPIIRENIRKNGLDIKLKISLGSDDGFIGYQQEIDNLTQTTMLDLVNPVVDVEKRKFKMGVPYTRFEFWFYENVNSFLGAGFTVDEIINRSSNLLNSFFILDYYDSYDPNTQTKIFTTYITKFERPSFNVSASTSQLYYWYVPMSYIAIQTGSTAIGYVRLSFYNAKTGKVQQFYNNYNTSAPIGLTPQKLYFKSELNLVNKTWRILNLVNSIVDARELVTSSAYSARIDNTFEKYDKVKQTYPSGSSYNYKTNTYVTLFD